MTGRCRVDEGLFARPGPIPPAPSAGFAIGPVGWGRASLVRGFAHGVLPPCRGKAVWLGGAAVSPWRRAGRCTNIVPLAGQVPARSL